MGKKSKICGVCKSEVSPEEKVICCERCIAEAERVSKKADSLIEHIYLLRLLLGICVFIILAIVGFV